MIKFESCCIIDDDEFFVYNAKRLMNEVDFCENIFSYHDGQQAIDALIGFMIEGIKLPEVIFLDLNMPRKDGWEFLKDFANLLPIEKQLETKIYIVSSFVSPENIEKAKAYNAVEEYILKPLKAEALQEILTSTVSTES